ncbi:MAG TPA: 4-(cytidine 5'-diphospho)-2-C-methyl-D-erythritol kinase [Clostridiaceae bacterium]|nr:4-(cytidine 5'-diphospho)-2-C-methyl-D-erythritol kinase [Clostridiaceae bacterium]
MIIRAHGKINLSLDIVGKREDGYHLLKMVMQSIDLHDEIELYEKAEGVSLSCDKEYVPTDQRNIAYKAAKLLLGEAKEKRGVHIHIKKNIPVAAGLAGGSADAAAVLKGLNAFYGLGYSEEALMNLGLSLGADVPFCLKGGTCLCEGIGEVVTPLPSFKDRVVVLVKPPFGVSTKDAYGAFSLEKIKRHVETEKLMSAMKQEDLQGVHYYVRNLLENVVLQKHPVVKRVKQQVAKSGAEVTLMSGSGPTVYGIYQEEEVARKAVDALRRYGNEVILTKTI